MSKKKAYRFKEVWDFPSSPWQTETDFLGWLRGQIRRIWNRHPVKIAYKNARRYKAPIGIKGKEVWCSNCEICGKQSRECEVDHKSGGYGFKDWDSFTEWQKRILLVSFDDIRELCPECHGIVTHQQKTGLSFEEAKAEKMAIYLRKEKKDVEWLQERGLSGKNATVRRKMIVEQIMKEAK